MKQIDWDLWPDDMSGLVLDVACHIPLDAEIFSRFFGVEHIYLVDLRALSRNSLPEKTSFVQNSATSLCFPNSIFDVVVSFSAIEHLPIRELQRTWVHEMVRVLKPGGILLVTVDNAWSWLNRIWDRFRPPMRRISPTELVVWVTESGNMKIEARTGGALYYWGFRPPMRIFSYPAYILDRILNLVSPFFPLLGNRIGYRFRKE